MAVTQRKPIRCLQGLVILMAANAINLFILSAPLLAVELLVVSLGAAVLVWMILLKPGRMKLAAPGRTRYNITKFMAFFVALWLFAVIWLAVVHSSSASENSFVPEQSQAGVMGLVAVLLLGTAVLSAVVVVANRRHQEEENSQ